LTIGIVQALLAAMLFGASTPLAKQLVGQVPPLLLAGLFYLGSGLGLFLFRLLRDSGWRAPTLTRQEWPWLIGAIFFGGVLGPAALMTGLVNTSAASASLLLNLEAVLTALIAWLVFRENADRRIVLGMLLIVVGGVVLSWPDSHVAFSVRWGTFAITAACLCWAIDNNLTRAVANTDALFIAGSKGLIAGVVNCSLALSMGIHLPSLQLTSTAMLIGLLGYGASLVLFVLALRNLGTARTGAYFSVAPFFGAGIAIALGEPTSWVFWLAAGCMAAGVWLHLTERHEHEHFHAMIDHDHRHVHDEHHQHEHVGVLNNGEPHSHAHTHKPLRHSHPHYPDAHHRHTH
jgi:drug/metabolite transporter (DMT)-like permease